MTSVYEEYSDSDDDSDYEPDVKLFFLNHEENLKAKIRTKNSENSAGTSLNFNCKLKDVKNSELNLVEAKKQAENVYESFLKEAAADMKLLKNECSSSKTIFTKVNTNSSHDTGCSKESSSSNVRNPSETLLKNCPLKDKMIDLNSSNLLTNSNSEINSSKLSTLSTMKRRDLKSVMGNVLKKKKKETLLSMSMQDWQKFKEEEDITNELKIYNQGKKGFIERQRFLERSDLRRFQIERDMRLSKKQTDPKNLF